jgi:hypothetical protein
VTDPTAAPGGEPTPGPAAPQPTAPAAPHAAPPPRWPVVVRALGVAAFTALVTLSFFFFLKNKHSLNFVLIDGTWDDGRTFYTIATQGYRGLPITEYRELGLYPLLVHLLHPVAGIYSLLIVSLTFSALGNVLVYFILRRWYAGEWLAFGAACVMAVARQPVFFMQFIKWQMPSMTICNAIQGSEGPYVAALLAAFYLYKADRLPWAFVCAGLASVTRMTGIVVAFGLYVDLLLRREWKRSFWALVSAAFLLAHFAYYWHLTGDFFVVFKAHHTYNHVESAFTWPFRDLLIALKGQYRELWEGPWGWVVIYAYCIAGLVILALKRQRTLLLITAPVFVMFLCLQNWSLHGRYYETLFGIPFAYVMLIAGRRGAAQSEPGRS